MFGRRRRSLKNAAIESIEQPRGTVKLPQGKTQNVYQAENDTGPTIVKVLGLFLAPFVLLWFVSRVFDALGSTRPEHEAALMLMSTLRIIFFFILILAASWFLSTYFLQPFFKHREYLKDRDAEIAESHAHGIQKQLPPHVESRMLSGDVRLYRAIIMAMDRAFATSDDTGQITTRNEPWSRRTVGRFQLLNESQAVGENSNLATDVKDWLLENGVLINDRRFDRDRFPDLDSIHRLLTRKLGYLSIAQTSARDSEAKESFSVIENSY